MTRGKEIAAVLTEQAERGMEIYEGFVQVGAAKEAHTCMLRVERLLDLAEKYMCKEDAS